MRKIQKKDWFTAGVALLGDDGPPRLTIEALALHLKVTKGSFYHHFGNMDGYTVALMQYWLEERSLAFIDLAERKKNAGRAALLSSLAAEMQNGAERAVRAWASSSPVVKVYLQQLDGIRHKYIAKMLLNQDVGDVAALRAARLEYALMVGLQQLYPDLSGEELFKMYEIRS